MALSSRDVDKAMREGWARVKPETKLLLQNAAQYTNAYDFLADGIALSKAQEDIDALPVASGPIGS